VPIRGSLAKGLLIALAVVLIPVTAVSAQKITPGSICKVLNQKVVYQNKTYVCIKSGKKLVWNKGVAVAKPVPVPTPSALPTATPTPSPSAIPTITPTPTATPTQIITAENLRFESLCAKDPFVPSEWTSYQDFALRNEIFGCARPYRFKVVSQPKTQPIQALTPKTSLNNIESCKLTHGQRNYGQIAFSSWVNPKIVMNQRLNVQVIPIEFTDFPSSKTVLADHERYFSYIKNAYSNISDSQVNINFKVPSDYFKVNKKISSYDTGKRFNCCGGGINDWVQLDMNRLFADIVSVVDPSIDFSNLDLVFFVVPPTTDNDYIGHGFPAPHPQLRTSEGFIPYWYFSPPMSEVSRKSWFGVEPYMHLHELMHAMNKLDDHHGDGDFGRIDGDAGTGNWSHMSGMSTDFLFWEKWITYMVSDDQVICAKTDSSSTHWIKPSNYFGKEEKLLVIPVDSTKVLVVESIRAAGFNLKIPRVSEGALVYLVDITKTGKGRGINVLRPSSRTTSILEIRNFALADAPLKIGESISSNGFKISVIESGDFGDVVKVEKVD
jgi:hypothetical protein